MLTVLLWRKEALAHRQEAARSYSPSMRQRIDLAKLYNDRPAVCTASSNPSQYRKNARGR